MPSSLYSLSPVASGKLLDKICLLDVQQPVSDRWQPVTIPAHLAFLISKWPRNVDGKMHMHMNFFIVQHVEQLSSHYVLIIFIHI